MTDEIYEQNITLKGDKFAEDFENFGLFIPWSRLDARYGNKLIIYHDGSPVMLRRIDEHGIEFVHDVRAGEDIELVVCYRKGTYICVSEARR